MSLLCCLKCLQVNKSYTELTFHTFVNISKPQTTLIIKGGKLISQRPCSALRNMAFDGSYLGLCWISGLVWFAAATALGLFLFR